MVFRKVGGWLVHSLGYLVAEPVLVVRVHVGVVDDKHLRDGDSPSPRWNMTSDLPVH